MYSLKNVLTQSPEKVSTAVVAIVNVGVIAGWIDVSKETLGGINIALVLSLGLFYVAPLTVSKLGLGAVQQATSDAHDAGVQVGVAAATPPPATLTTFVSGASGPTAMQFSPDDVEAAEAARLATLPPPPASPADVAPKLAAPKGHASTAKKAPAKKAPAPRKAPAKKKPPAR